MKTPQLPAMPGMSPLGIKPKTVTVTVPSNLHIALGLAAITVDQKTVAERQWQSRKLAPKPQKPCDHGLFSDEANQLDLVEMLQDPTNGE